MQFMALFCQIRVIVHNFRIFFLWVLRKESIFIRIFT